MLGKSLFPLLLSLAAATATADTLNLESPLPDEKVSGVGTVRGWTCDAQRIELKFDDGERMELPYGTERKDTESACGDTDNGFVTQFNYGKLGDGDHRLEIYRDGELVLTRTFQVTTLGAPYLTGLQASFVLPAFPDREHQVRVSWSEPAQNFVIFALETNQGGGGQVGIAGAWVAVDPQGLALVVTEETRDGQPWAVAVLLDFFQKSFDIFEGPIDETGKARISTLYSNVEVEADLYLTDDDHAEVEVLSCAPQASCEVVPGQVFELDRFYK